MFLQGTVCHRKTRGKHSWNSRWECAFYDLCCSVRSNGFTLRVLAWRRSRRESGIVRAVYWKERRNSSREQTCECCTVCYCTENRRVNVACVCYCTENRHVNVARSVIVRRTDMWMLHVSVIVQSVMYRYVASFLHSHCPACRHCCYFTSRIKL